MKKKKLIIVICIILLILVILLAFILREKDQDNSKKYPEWTNEVDRVDYMKVKDYLNNTCDYKYYTPNFKIVDDILYDNDDNLIKENVYTLNYLNYGECNIGMVFVTTINGKVYYINNLVDSKYKKYQLVEINNVSNIVNVVADEDNNITMIDNVESETNINDYITEIFKN